MFTATTGADTMVTASVTVCYFHDFTSTLSISGCLSFRLSCTFTSITLGLGLLKSDALECWFLEIRNSFAISVVIESVVLGKSLQIPTGTEYPPLIPLFTMQCASA